MLIDTHAHLNFNAYKDDSDEVIKRSLDNNIWLINIGSQYSTSKRAVKIAEKYQQGVYAAVGLHPIHLETNLIKIKNDFQEIEYETRKEEFDYEKYKELARSSKVAAIGEIGLDYWYKPKTKTKFESFKQKQKTILYQQIRLAEELDLPIIFHCRAAHNDLIEILEAKNREQKRKIKAVIHCFTGNQEQAEKYLEMGFYLGFNGIIFKLNLDEIIKKIPLDKILIETDCPYLTPAPMVGRNEPIYIKYIAERIAKIKNLNFEKISEITTQNARNLFSIKSTIENCSQ